MHGSTCRHRVSRKGAWLTEAAPSPWETPASSAALSPAKAGWEPRLHALWAGPARQHLRGGVWGGGSYQEDESRRSQLLVAYRSVVLGGVLLGTGVRALRAAG